MADIENAANDNTNVQPSADNNAQQQNGVPATDTMLGGNGANAQQQNPQPQPAAQGAPDQYDFKASIPEGMEIDAALTKDFSDIARGMNLTNEQANQMAQFGFKYGQQIAEAVQNQYNAEVTRWGEAAKAELGANFEKVMSAAGAGIEAVEKVVPGIRKALNETGAGNRIEVIRAFEMFGLKVREDPGMVNVNGSGQPQQATTWYPNSKM